MTTIQLDRLDLQTPMGASLALADVTVATYSDGDVRLTFTVPYEDYLEIVGQRLFHLEPEAIRPALGGALRAGIAVEIDLAPADRARARLRAALANGERLEGDTVLGSTETYYALHVKQAAGPLKIGYATAWAPLAAR